MNKKALIILSVGHLVTDLNQGALPALLPFFKETLALSYTMAGVIMLLSNLTSSVIQPVFGYLCDKRPSGLFLLFAPFVACLGMSFTGLVDRYGFLLTAVIIAGIGIASFHPQAYQTAYLFSGDKKATGMSIFSVGGNLGIAIGPIWGISLVAFIGSKGTLGMVIPGIVLGLIMLPSIRWLTPQSSVAKQTQKGPQAAFSKKGITSLIVLISVVITRTWIQIGLVTYIPFYYIDFLKGNPLYAGKLVTTFLMAGALGTLLGAPLADRWGHKKFLSSTLIGTIPVLTLFYNTGGWIGFGALAVAGMLVVSSFTVTVVMAQVLLPKHVGMASGVMVGFAVGTGGMGVTLLGIIADHWGVPTAMKSILVLPLLGFILSLLIKYPPRKDDEKE